MFNYKMKHKERWFHDFLISISKKEESVTRIRTRFVDSDSSTYNPYTARHLGDQEKCVSCHLKCIVCQLVKGEKGED